MYKNIIFDLDGTLMDTLNDIKDAANEALKICGYNYQYTYESAKFIIGGGADLLISKTLSRGNPNYTEEDFKKFKSTYIPLYKKYQDNTTAPFIGINETLDKLRKLGIKCYILTNKPDFLTEIVVNRFFPSQIDGFMGQSDLYPPKPDKSFTYALMHKYNLNKEDTLYVGDSEFDVLTAKNAELDMVLCQYGYGDYQNMDKSYVKYIINKPNELIDIFKE